MKKFAKGLAGFFSAGMMTLFALSFYLRLTLPDEFIISGAEELKIPSVFSLGHDFVPDLDAESYTVSLKLLDSIPVKNVQIQVAERRMVVPGGMPFGIKMFTRGVMVVGMSDIQIGMESVNPSKSAGLKIGDILLSINGREITRNDDIKSSILNSSGEQLHIQGTRAGNAMDFYLQPVKTEYDDTYKAGIWVRDSSAGIGTMTYYDPVSLSFAGLGHAVCDVDTGKLMPLSSGEIVDVNITGSNAGQSGKPGELKGSFSSSGEQLGLLKVNSEMGLFGKLQTPWLDCTPIPMAYKQEIKPGPAKIRSTISGNKPQEFDIVIEKVNYSEAFDTKNMVIRVVDERLLAATGGIVQGMSGSPIIQNGKLVGAVTHVFVNDPTRGYSIFAENMDKEMKFAEYNNN